MAQGTILGETQPTPEMPEMPPLPPTHSGGKTRIIVVGATVVAIIAGAIAVQQHNKSAAAAKVKVQAAACVAAVSPAVNAFSDLDAKLNVGMNESEYSSDVQDASVELNRVSSAGLEPTCSQIVAHLGDALRSYSAADSSWNACITDYYTTSCGPDNVSLTAELQGDWQSAQNDVASAKTALSREQNVSA